MTWLRHGIIITMDQNKIYTDGCIEIIGKKLGYVGPDCDIPAEDRVIDVSGAVILPGIIEAHSHIGITEDKKGVEGDDCNEMTNPVTPYLRAIDGINPLDPAFHNAIMAGITSAMIGPGSANVVGGQFVFMKTNGRSVDEMIVKEPAAMKIAFGENPKTQYGNQGEMPGTRMAIAALLREELVKAQNYQKKKIKDPNLEPDFRMECWLPVLEHKIPLKAHAHRTDDIQTAIRIGKEFDLDMTLDHCTEGHLIVDEIKESGYPAICGPYLTSRNKLEIQNSDIKTPEILMHAGILTAITTDHPVTMIQYLPIEASYAVKKGMEPMEALEAITCNAAKICRVEDRVGRLIEGLDADIAVFSGDPLDVRTNVLYTFIDGVMVYDRNKSDDDENTETGYN